VALALWFTRRAPRTDRTRAALLLWGGWLVVTAATFSFMQGIFHAYYTVALAPAIGALVGIGAAVLWRFRWHILLALTVAGTAVWSAVLLARSATFVPWLRVAVVIAGLVAAGLLLMVRRMPALAVRGTAALALLAVLAGPAAYALDTVATSHAGAIPSAGPVVAGARGGPGGGPAGGPGGPRVFGGPGGAPGGPPGAGGPRALMPGGPTGGGLLNASTPSSELVAALNAGSASYTWAAATVGSNNAAGYQLATGKPVMALGGFNGSDPSPTLAQFQQWVSQHRIHYFIGGGFSGAGGGPGGARGPGGNTDGGSNTAQQIAEWVAATYTSTTIGGVTVYDLSS